MGRSGRPLKWHICEVRKRICEDRNRLSGRAWCVRLPFVRALPSALGCVLCAACLGACVCRSFVGSPCAGRHHKASCFFCETTEARLLGMLSFCFLAPTKPPISDLEHVGTVTFLGNARKQGPLRHFFLHPVALAEGGVEFYEIPRKQGPLRHFFLHPVALAVTTRHHALL